MKERINTVADLLMAAAHADCRLEGVEQSAVRRLLRSLVDAEELPADLEQRLQAFQPGAFDVAQAGAAFAADPPATKRQLLELLANVHGADEEYDLAEDELVHQLGKAMGLDEGTYRDLVANVVEEIQLRASSDALRRQDGDG